MLFIDSSCLVELLVKQSKWKLVRDTLDSEKSGLIISYFSILEIQSALHRLLQSKVISKKNYEVAQLNLAGLRESWNLVPVSNAILDRAFNLQIAHQLKPGDAIQLSSAMTLDSSTESTRFFTFDSQLKKAATLERLVPI